MSINFSGDFIKLKQLLDGCSKIIIAGHVNPDGDAIGSCLAFALCMKAVGKQPCVLLGEYSRKYDFLQGREFVYNGDYKEVSGDAFVAFDTSAKSRLTEAALKVFERTKLKIVVDHHISNSNFGDYNFVIPDASSTSEIVYDIACEYKSLTNGTAKAIAENIYTGILSDTNGFRHDSTSAKTHYIAADLISKGINFNAIYTRTQMSRSLEEVRIFATALNKFKIDEAYPIAYTSITVGDMEEAGAKYSDLDNIVEYFLNIDGVEVSFMLKEHSETRTKVSMRSRNIDVSQIAVSLGGGGHKKAAGVTLELSSANACDTILNAVRHELGKTTSSF